MAILRDAYFHIGRDTLEVGSICEIQYQYVLCFEENEIALNMGIECRVVLWGVHLVGDAPLGKGFYDIHNHVAKQTSLEEKRRFVVPCEILNDTLGLDEIYLSIICQMSSGEQLSIKTSSVIDHF